MIEVGNTIVSREVFQTEFVCNISACKGECCVSGDAGAPLTDQEHNLLASVYPKIMPFMRSEGIEAVAQQGTSVYDSTDQEYETPLVDNAECAYVVFGEDGSAQCAIEKAYTRGEIDWVKPISCHLYPIRIKAYKNFDAINYDHWDICDDACTLGQSLGVPVYRFLKEPLIRKYGEEWYMDLVKTAALINTEYTGN